MTLNLKLGTEVTFNRVIKREQFGRKTKPVPVQLPETLEGIIVGIRAVYDAFRDDGSIESSLSNRQTVLLVATSLHRTYKVFPCDAVSVNSAAPVQTQTGGYTLPLQQITPTRKDDPTMAYQKLTDQELEALVSKTLAEKVDAKEEFTAYDVTQELRRSNRGVEIPHGQVRDVVHALMETYVGAGFYERDTAMYGSNQAVKYVPATVLVALAALDDEEDDD